MKPPLLKPITYFVNRMHLMFSFSFRSAPFLAHFTLQYDTHTHMCTRTQMGIPYAQYIVK